MVFCRDSDGAFGSKSPPSNAPLWPLLRQQPSRSGPLKRDLHVRRRSQGTVEAGFAAKPLVEACFGFGAAACREQRPQGQRRKTIIFSRDSDGAFGSKSPPSNASRGLWPLLRQQPRRSGPRKRNGTWRHVRRRSQGTVEAGFAAKPLVETCFGFGAAASWPV